MQRVLVVDDEPAITMMLRMILSSEGLEVSTASSAADAQHAMRKTEFDVIVTDMRMETSVSGMEVAGFAKASPSKPSVVILSAFPMQTSEWAGLADAYLQKGGSVTELVDVVESLLRSRAA
jgi:two-component system response regulator MtrA